MIHCPTCASPLRFDIESQQLVCDHCDNKFDVQDVKDSERDDAKSTDFFEAHIYVCPSCGAELATNDENDAIGFCPYCGGASMLHDRVRSDWKPQYVIPFKVTKEECKKAYIKEVKKHFFVSSKYRKPELIESFKGIYMPYWYFETEQVGEYSVKNLKKVESDSDYFYTTHYDQYYSIDRRVKGYSHDASLSFDDYLSEKLAPYESEGRKDFHPGYLSGFYAEIGDAEEEEYKKIVVSKINDNTSELICKQNNVDKQRVNLPAKVTSMECSLNPVWFMSYRRKNKISYAAVNGQTGKVAADLPLSPLKILLTALLISLVTFSTLFNVMLFLPSVKANTTLAVCASIMFAGLFYLYDSFLETVSKAIDYLNPYPFSGSFSGGGYFLYGLMSLLMTNGILFMASDGSFGKTGFYLGLLLFAFSVFVIFKHLFTQFRKARGLNLNLFTTTESQIRNGVIAAAKRYFVVFRVLRLVSFASILFCFVIANFDIIPKTLCYILCCVLAVEMLLFAVMNIIFQSKISLRRPPQMDKKGALYDEE